MSPDLRADELGVLGWLAMIGDTHHRLTGLEFTQRLQAARRVGRIEVLCRQQRPVAWLLWRRPVASEWRALLDQHGATQAELDTCPPGVWLDFWVRPWGCDPALADAVRERVWRRVGPVDALSWCDPSDRGGAGTLHLNVPWQALPGK